MKISTILITIVAVLSAAKVLAQSDSTLVRNAHIVENPFQVDSSKQRDAIDMIVKILNGKTDVEKRDHSRKLIFAAVPGLGYSLSTGFAGVLIANLAFYTGSDHKENLSEISATTYIDTKTQKVLKVRSEVWGDKNNYKLVGDLRFLRYPEDTYGIGTSSPNSSANHINYLYLRTYLTFYKKIAENYYLGLGYNLDHHYDITALGNADGSVSDFTKYGQSSTSTSSGTSFNFLFDSRQNPINPLQGGYARITVRNNLTFLGSDNNWNQVQVDLRRYIRVSPSTNNNILAIWAIAAFTQGNVPYLDMPSTSSDMYNNSGRGYKQDRFLGKNELYLETEYRFGLTKNGLLGAVVFANAESFSEFQTNQFQRIAPAAGTGLRVKINKHSNSNACFDYATGIDGSHGFFISLGEVF